MTTAVGENPTIEEIVATIEQNQNPDQNQTDPTSPTPVFSDSDFKDLTTDDDDENLVTNELEGFAGGLRALDGNDTVTGSLSNEAINGNLGFDSLLGGSGNDTIRGGQNDDRIFGENDDDIVNGNRGDDFVIGGNGDDIVRGGQDDDLLIGGEGQDTLIGDFGTDYMIGNDADDLFVLRTETGESTSRSADWIIDFDPSDDSIGLTGGLDDNDLTFETITFDLNSEIGFLQRFTGEDISANTGVTTASLDPNGDGIIEGVLIRNNDDDSTFFNTVLGIVINVTEADINNEFVTVPDSVLSLG